MNGMTQFTRGQATQVVLVGLFIWAVMGGCSWRLPKDPPEELQHVLKRAAKIKDPQRKNAILKRALHAKVEEFQSLIEQNLILRERILQEANRLEDLFAWNRGEVEANDLKLVSQGAAHYLELRNELLTVVDRYRCLLDYSEEELLRNDVDPRLRLVAIMVSIGAALTLYDNYLMTVVRFEQSSALRRYVNHGDDSMSLDRRQMEKIGQSARSVINRSQLRGAIMDYEEWKTQYPEWKNRFQTAKDEIEVLDDDFAYLETLIRNSLSYHFIAQVHPGKLSEMKLKALSRTLPDLIHESSENFLRELTRAFVEAIAVVEVREGLLYTPEERRAEALDHLSSILKPGDILLEKSLFRLTDRMVPGYWGHVGIWLGTEEELSVLKIWDDPGWDLRQSSQGSDARKMIQEGKCLIEAVRGGVTLNTLEHFLNVDDLAVLRPQLNEDPTRLSERRDTLLTALSHMGKPYDFEFDVHTRDRIVCSELIFQTYTQPEFDWPRGNMLGRYTISPDQVAIRALPTLTSEPPLRVIVFYHKWERLGGNRNEWETFMSEILRVKEYEKTYLVPGVSGHELLAPHRSETEDDPAIPIPSSQESPP